MLAGGMHMHKALYMYVGEGMVCCCLETIHIRKRTNYDAHCARAEERPIGS